MPTRLKPLLPRTSPTPRAACLLLALGLGLAVAAPPALAQYKWKDRQGQLHVSDMPPPADVPEANILKRPAGRRAPPAAAPASAAAGSDATSPAARGVAVAASAPQDPELVRRRQRAEQEAKAKADAEAQSQAAVRAENCQRARQQIALVQSGQRMVRVAPNGERVVLDDAARGAELSNAQRIAASDCR